MIHGWILIDKHKGVTSRTVDNRIQKFFKQKGVGHLGTLDPMAMGLLPVAIGEATKVIPYISNHKKTYEAIFDFGYQTDTLDTTGNTIQTCDRIPTLEEIEATLPSFLGTQFQVPPAYSAIKIGGQRAYDLARKGHEVHLPTRETKIYELSLISFEENHLKVKITCEQGFYVRSFGLDLAKKLDSLATMTYLQRTHVGNLSVTDAISLASLEEMPYNQAKDGYVKPCHWVLDDIPDVVIGEDQLKALRCGQRVPVSSSHACTVAILAASSLVGFGMIQDGFVYPKRLLNI